RKKMSCSTSDTCDSARARTSERRTTPRSTGAAWVTKRSQVGLSPVVSRCSGVAFKSFMAIYTQVEGGASPRHPGLAEAPLCRAVDVGCIDCVYQTTEAGQVREQKPRVPVSIRPPTTMRSTYDEYRHQELSARLPAGCHPRPERLGCPARAGSTPRRRHGDAFQG